MKPSMSEFDFMNAMAEDIDPIVLSKAVKAVSDALERDGKTSRCPKLWQAMIEVYLLAKNDKLKRGFIFSGKAGAGKTYCAYLLCAMQRSPFEILSALEIREMYRSDRDSFYRLANKESHIIVDDLGAENVFSDFGCVTEVLQEFILLRHEVWSRKGKTTSFTTNLNGSARLERYKIKAHDRLIEMTNSIGTSIGSQRKRGDWTE